MVYDLKHKYLILMMANSNFSSLGKTNKPSVTFHHISCSPYTDNNDMITV